MGKTKKSLRVEMKAARKMWPSLERSKFRDLRALVVKYKFSVAGGEITRIDDRILEMLLGGRIATGNYEKNVSGTTVQHWAAMIRPKPKLRRREISLVPGAISVTRLRNK
jgi:hypothetical protein